MLIKNNELFELPELMAGSFSGMDRLEIPYNILILRQVSQRDDNGEIELICKAKDGPEIKRGWIVFVDPDKDRAKKDMLYSWFQKQIGKDIETIYKSDFSFESERL